MDSISGIAERHRVGHTAAKNATDSAETELMRLEKDGADDEDRQYSERKTHGEPDEALGADDGIEELRAGIETKACEVERETESAEHKIGTARGESDDMERRAKSTGKDADNDGAASHTEFDGD